ncbi:kinesin-domain-containing protein [Rhizopus microsporus]|uniref:Kinesin-like protein n=1 Tax=Rhizopus microsporus TaxID=58291 RepID=A0A1X0S4B4_RHIZD|nr:kinesin-domain-containing protein [Rhizopus microsporus]
MAASPHRGTGHHNELYRPDKEPVKAYLRIRPKPPHYESDMEDPYLQIINDLEISMTPPQDSNAYRTRNRAPERYRFTRIFTESVTQQEFFNKTTLPLIQDVLRGENALIFAYGVTNSGKTYSIMGTKKQPGLLPRTLDVIFNSIDGFLSDSKVKPCMHSLVQTYIHDEEENRNIFDNPNMEKEIWENRDTTAIPIEQNFEYGIWLSFAEIYTEKIYDLLVRPDHLSKRQALPLKYEYSSGHKYIAGLKEVRVQSIDEAYAILLEGQRNRAEYSTMTNPTSSRSHSIFTIRIVRVPIDENDYIIEDPVYATVSRFSIVDLAGSERYRNTLNFGQRLKEAGNINKSLMVLGQCMETLRLNQVKIAMGKKPMMVPYRHSKLTELFKSSFEGDGKAVMVVNVNPFDTGFDENSHVMKFAAVARDVTIWRRMHPRIEPEQISNYANKRPRTQHRITRRIYEEEMMRDDMEEPSSTIIKQSSNTNNEEEEEEEYDPFVDNLIEQLEDLRNKWIEAEGRNTTLEARQKAVQDIEAEMNSIKQMYLDLLDKQNKLSESETQHLNETNKQDLVKEILDRQDMLKSELSQFRNYTSKDEDTKMKLLERIAELEKDKQKQQEHIQELYREVNRLRLVAQEKTEKEQNAESMQSMEKDPVFDRFLDLRKKLRRSIFRGEEYSHDADVIMGEIEQFQDVTFELVKETNMGKLLKLITQREFKHDPYNIKQRAKTLFKKYAKISIPILASKKPSQMVAISVDAGGEEEFISDMRNALHSLQDENNKLKCKLKIMQEGQRRLKEAFEKTRSTPVLSQESRDTESESFSPVLGAVKEEEDHLTLIDDVDNMALSPGQPTFPRQMKRKRTSIRQPFI